MKLNPNKEQVLKIIEAIYKNNGYCPCRVNKSQESVCPCKDFIENKKCKCNLFI